MHMSNLRHNTALLAGMAALAAALSLDASLAAQWPDRAWLIAGLVHEVPDLLKSQNPDTGRFGGDPWVCMEQNVIFPLAAAWATQDPANPYYHDEQVLKAICKGGEALVAEQDPEGMWVFRQKDNSTWGQIHMPWTYSRWIRAYALIREAMPAESRDAWERGLLLGFRGIRRYMDQEVRNIPAHHAMALYIAGECFQNAEWQEAARKFMARTVAAQDSAGFWSENFGPVVGYNMVYMEAIGTYYAVSHDASVLPALERGARFHAAMVWPDGTPVAAVDERQIYHRERSIGNVGFSHTAAGRGFLISQTQILRDQDGLVNADYAAAMLVYGGTGAGETSAVRGDHARVVIGDRKALVQRDKPWQVCFSAYCCPVPRNRWIQDRHNLVDVFHDELGLLIGGGNTKLQPYWSTFTLGDPDKVGHRGGDANPDFTPAAGLRWVPTRSTLNPDATCPSLDLIYHDHTGRVSTAVTPDGALLLTYEAVTLAGGRFEAHVPFLKRQGRIRFAAGQALYLTEAPVKLKQAQTGGWFEWDSLRVEIPPGATLLWPARQHNPYAKDGQAPLANAKLVMTLPFAPGTLRYQVAIRRAPACAIEGRVYEARQLPVRSRTETRVKPLDDLGSLLLSAARPGDSMALTVTVESEGTYELFTDFCLYPRYGVAQVSVDGAPAGAPFDAYAPEMDVSGPVSMGEVLLTAGRHEIGITVIGRNPQASGYLLSVRTFRLRPVAQAAPP
jgi:hypothetical protein